MMNNETQKRAVKGQLPEEYTREYLVYMIRAKTGRSLSQNSKAHGFERTAFATALQKPWSNVEKIIAKIVGDKPWNIWPERYDANKRPINSSRPRRRFAA